MTRISGRFGERVAAEIRLTPVFNWTGGAALSLPLHWTADGLPIGTHFGGDLGDEGLLLRLAAQIEAAHPWFDKTPEL